MKGKFDRHFMAQKNVNQSKLNLVQDQHVTEENFILTDLLCLAEACEYGSLNDEMIPVRLVVGIMNDKLGEKLQVNAGLTLDNAFQQVRQSVTIIKHQRVI